MHRRSGQLRRSATFGGVGSSVLRRFRPGWVPTLATVAAVAILVSLGSWQVRRHAWRQADLAAKDASLERPPVAIEAVLAGPDEHAWRRATAAGVWDRGASILVAPVARGLREGAHVLTPLRCEQGAAVLVDRGWVPSSRGEEFLPGAGGAASAPSGEPSDERVEVTGLVFPLAVAGARPGRAEAPRRVWPHFDPTRAEQVALLQSQIPYPLAPVMLQRGEGDEAGLPLGGFERPHSPVDHRLYAITWYAMAAVAVATWIGLGVHRAREEPEERAG